MGKGIIVAVVLLVIFILFLNPVMFLIWSIVRPKAAAGLLYEMDLPVFEDIMQALNGWMIALYPFRMKKYFMEVRGIDNYSAKLQCRYYHQVNSSAATLKQMSDEGRRRLWNKGMNADKAAIIAAGIRLTDEQFRTLAFNGHTKEISLYVSRWTPSSEMVKSLIENHRLGCLVEVCKRYGLSAELVNMLFDQPDKEMVEDAQEALVVYSHRQIVLRTADQQSETNMREWNVFCNKVKGGHIRVEAQKLMNSCQYDALHKAGHVLEKAAVEEFLATGDVAMCSRIFKYEENYGRVSDIADALVAANPKLTAALLKVMSEREA